MGVGVSLLKRAMPEFLRARGWGVVEKEDQTGVHRAGQASLFPAFAAGTGGLPLVVNGLKTLGSKCGLEVLEDKSFLSLIAPPRIP